VSERQAVFRLLIGNNAACDRDLRGVRDGVLATGLDVGNALLVSLTFSESAEVHRRQADQPPSPACRGNSPRMTCSRPTFGTGSMTSGTAMIVTTGAAHLDDPLPLGLQALNNHAKAVFTQAAVSFPLRTAGRPSTQSSSTRKASSNDHGNASTSGCRGHATSSSSAETRLHPRGRRPGPRPPAEHLLVPSEVPCPPIGGRRVHPV
jgi:hypothetical protein